MTYRKYVCLRMERTPEAMMQIKNMDSLQREVYERAFRHMVEHERERRGGELTPLHSLTPQKGDQL